MRYYENKIYCKQCNNYKKINVMLIKIQMLLILKATQLIVF